jgi:DNA-binding GntR family transcriptional regulator
MNARSPSSLLTAPALYIQVAEQLRTRILSHELAPGSWIDEQALTSEYGISRTPLREALKVLAAEGLVQLKPRRGCYVAEVSDRDVDEVFPVMAVLEAKVAEEATRRATNADFSRLQAIHDDLERYAESGDVELYFDANQRFHLALQEIAGNSYLQQIIDDARKLIKLVRHDSLLQSGRVTQSLLEHRGILEAILARDADLAARRMHQHLLSGRKAVASLQPLS